MRTGPHLLNLSTSLPRIPDFPLYGITVNRGVLLKFLALTLMGLGTHEAPAQTIGGSVSVYQQIQYQSPQILTRDSQSSTSSSLEDAIINYSAIPNASGSSFFKVAVPYLPNDKRTYSLECGVDFLSNANVNIYTPNLWTWVDDSLTIEYLPGAENTPLPPGPLTARFVFHVVAYSSNDPLQPTQGGGVNAHCWFSSSYDGNHGTSPLVTNSVQPINNLYESALFGFQFGVTQWFQMSLAYAGGTGVFGIASHTYRAKLAYAGAKVYDGDGNLIDPSRWNIYRGGAVGGPSEPGSPAIVSGMPDPSSVVAWIDPESEFFQGRNLKFSPVLPGYNYNVEVSPNLTSGSWTPLVDGLIKDKGTERTVTDTSASWPTKFYRVKISPTP